MRSFVCLITSTIFLLLQQLITQCDVCIVLFTYQINRNISIKNEERYGETRHGVPLSFQEFFQIRQT